MQWSLSGGGMHRLCQAGQKLTSVVLLALALVFPCPAGSQLSESQSLQLFFQQTAGESWTKSDGWTLYDDDPQAGSHCSWYGVTCCSPEGQGDTGHGSLPCSTSGTVVALVRAEAAFPEA